MLKKLIFLLAWLGIFLISLVSINYILLPNQFIFENPFLDLKEITAFEFKMAVLVISTIYIFICLIKFFSIFERKKDYEKKTENGTLKISRNTINNYVADLLRRDIDITGIKVNSELKGKKFLVYIKFELLAKLNISAKIEEVQAMVKKELTENVGVDVSKVLVNISKLGIKEKEVEKEVNKQYSDVEENI